MIEYQDMRFGDSLEKKESQIKYARIMQDMYERTKAQVRHSGSGRTFQLTVGLHKRSALSFYIFNLVMDSWM